MIRLRFQLTSGTRRARREDDQLLESAGAFTQIGCATLGDHLVKLKLRHAAEGPQHGQRIGPGGNQPRGRCVGRATGRRLHAGAGGKGGKDGKEEENEPQAPSRPSRDLPALTNTPATPASGSAPHAAPSRLSASAARAPPHPRGPGHKLLVTKFLLLRLDQPLPADPPRSPAARTRVPCR